MVSFDQLKDYMNRLSDQEKQIKSVKFSGATLEEALQTAAIELGVKLRDLEYELLEKGDKGFAGVGKKAWVINAYKLIPKIDLKQDVVESVTDSISDLNIARDVPGDCYVKCTHDGVFLKATRPIGRAAKASDRQAFAKLSKRGIDHYDSEMVTKIVKQAAGQYFKIADYSYNPINDAVLTVEIVDMEMKAYMTMRPPGRGGADLSFENIVGIIRNNGIVQGILENVIQRFEDEPDYNSSILIAEGRKPVNGKDAKINYHFNVDRNTVKLKEETSGKVDYKELNLVENVVAGQVLAKKIPPEKGIEGKTITGKTLPAKSGKDVPIAVGKNVKLSEDGTTVISEINGQALLIAGKINVEPVYTIAGDVNLQTGNVLFLGTVIIKGSVLDGFSVKAAGNIEVKGNVGKCLLDAEGDVIVHQGILGKNGGMVKSGKSVYSKFIEHAHIEARENVVVNEGIVHTTVSAKKRIICQGRRASIVGGKLRAAEEINAKNLGSIAGSETILEVGYDPELKEKLTLLDHKYSEIEKEMDELDLNIKTLMNFKKVQRQLPEEKEKYLVDLNEKKGNLLNQADALNKEIEEIRQHLASLKEEGRVSALEKVFPGVKIYIKDAYLEVKNEFKFVTFILEHNNVKVTKYEGVEEGFNKRRVG